MAKDAPAHQRLKEKDLMLGLRGVAISGGATATRADSAWPDTRLSRASAAALVENPKRQPAHLAQRDGDLGAMVRRSQIWVRSDDPGRNSSAAWTSPFPMNKGKGFRSGGTNR